MTRFRVNNVPGATNRALRAVQEGGTIDIDYGELSADVTFRKIGSLQLRVGSVRTAGNGRELTCTDQLNRPIILTYYPRYNTAYVDLPD